jgi:hypothetical protein
MKSLVTTLILASLTLAAAPARAQQPGQFQVTPLPTGSKDSYKALIIDTTNGNLWLWSSGMAIPFKPWPGMAPGTLVETSALNYQGTADMHRNFYDGKPLAEH